MKSKHITRAFEDDLGKMETLIVEMGGLVESQLAGAIQALSLRDVKRADGIIARDRRVDLLEQEIDELAVRILAHRQPFSRELRTVLASIKIASNLERIGDYTKNLAKRSNILAENEPVGSSVDAISRMAQLVQRMIKNALDAYLARDSAVAEEVRQSDTDVDQIHNSLFRELLTYMMEDPRKTTACTHLLFITKNIERMGDHVTGIAEQVFYLSSGKMPCEERKKEDRTYALGVSLAGLTTREGDVS